MNNIESFVSVTSSSIEDADDFLKMADGNLDVAISLYFDNRMGDSGGNINSFDEEIRECDPQVFSRLNDESDDTPPLTPPPAPKLEPLPEYIPFVYHSKALSPSQTGGDDYSEESIHPILSFTRVQVRFPNGNKKVFKMKRSDTVRTLFALIANELTVYLSDDDHYNSECGYSSFESTFQLVKIQGMKILEPSNKTLEDEGLREHTLLVRNIRIE
jgi:hypothetical protein